MLVKPGINCISRLSYYFPLVGGNLYYVALPYHIETHTEQRPFYAATRTNFKDLA